MSGCLCGGRHRKGFAGAFDSLHMLLWQLSTVARVYGRVKSINMED